MEISSNFSFSEFEKSSELENWESLQVPDVSIEGKSPESYGGTHRRINLSMLESFAKKIEFR